MKTRASQPGATSAQLAVEAEWLTGRLPGSFLRTPLGPSPADKVIVERIQGFLSDPRLVPFLRIVEQHNNRPRREPGRRTPSKPCFLLGPYLLRVLDSVRQTNEMRQRLPVLNLPAAETRDHLQNVATKCKNLAGLIRKGPQPYVALAGATRANEALMVFAPWTELFEASDASERQIVAFTELMERATAGLARSPVMFRARSRIGIPTQARSECARRNSLWTCSKGNSAIPITRTSRPLPRSFRGFRPTRTL